MKNFFKDKKNLNICLCILLFLMGVVYAGFSQNLTIQDTASSASNWNVYISDVEISAKSENAVGSFNIDSREKASFQTNLTYPGDYVIYNVTVTNGGNIDATLNDITLTKSNNSSAILYSTNNISEGDEISAQNSKTFSVTVTYDANQTGTLTDSQKRNGLTLDLDFVQ